MTKQVRIENADTNDYKVLVEVWDKGLNGEPDKLANVINLDYPTALRDVFITETRYAVVREVPIGERNQL